MAISEQAVSPGEEPKVVLIRQDEEFFRMEKEWNALLEESRTNTIFLTWEWLTSWWRAYGQDKELYLLCVYQRGRLIGIAPFYRKTVSRFKIFSFRELVFLGDGSRDSDYMDCISRCGEEEKVTDAVVDFLRQNPADWNLILLNEVPEESPHLPLLRKLFHQLKWYWRESEAPCTYVNLPSAWNEYLKALKPRVRTKVRSLTSRLEQNFKVEFDYCRAEELESRLESLFQLHNQRWEADGREGVFVSTMKRRFYREMSSLFLTRGWLRFYTLAVDNRCVAHQFCFEYLGKMFLLQEGFDPKWAEHGVGNVLRAYVFQDCIGRKVSVYDFLGGVTAHKLSWGGAVKKSVRGTAGPPNLKNILFFESLKALEAGKKGLKAILPGTVLAWGGALKWGKSPAKTEP